MLLVTKFSWTKESIDKLRTLLEKLRTDLYLFTNSFVHSSSTTDISETRRNLQISRDKKCKLVHMSALDKGGSNLLHFVDFSSDPHKYAPYFCVFNPSANDDSRKLREFPRGKGNNNFLLAMAEFFTLCRERSDFEDIHTITRNPSNPLKDVLVEDLLR